MAQLTIEINGKSYAVGCEDGQEAHLRSLAAQVDSQVRQVAQDVGSLGETRLLLMAALMVADELAAAKVKLSQIEADLAHLRDASGRAEAQAAAALDRAAEALDAIGH